MSHGVRASAERLKPAVRWTSAVCGIPWRFGPPIGAAFLVQLFGLGDSVPRKMTREKRGTLILSSLLEDLDGKIWMKSKLY